MKNLRGFVLADCLLGILLLAVIVTGIYSLNRSRSFLEYDPRDEEMIELWESEDREELFVVQKPDILQELIPRIVTDLDVLEDLP